MSFFVFDDSQVKSGSSLMKEGTYEAIISEVETGKTMNGQDKMVVTYKVREDVDQEYKGRELKYNNFTFGSDAAKGMVQGLLKSCGFGSGHAFDSIQDLAMQLVDKTVKIVVKHEADYNDSSKMRARVKYTQPSAVMPPVKINVSENDLPF